MARDAGTLRQGVGGAGRADCNRIGFRDGFLQAQGRHPEFFGEAPAVNRYESSARVRLDRSRPSAARDADTDDGPAKLLGRRARKHRPEGSLVPRFPNRSLWKNRLLRLPVTLLAGVNA